MTWFTTMAHNFATIPKVCDYPGHLCDYVEAADLSLWEIGGSFAPWPLALADLAQPGPIVWKSVLLFTHYIGDKSTENFLCFPIDN